MKNGTERYMVLAALFVALMVLLSTTLDGRAQEPTPENPNKESIPIEPHIIGGQDAEPGEWPWQVALVRRGRNIYSGQFCGGSLIHTSWVLTAAHCVNGLPAAEVDVVAGIQNLTNPEAGFQRLAVQQIIIHPAYNANTQDSDVALLKLAKPATLGPTAGGLLVQTVALASATAGNLAGETATVTGWGAIDTSPTTYIPELQEVTVPVITNNACRQQYGNIITANMLCAGYAQGGKDSCYGDSGGPLVVFRNGKWEQGGIVSWGIGCAVPGYPGVYTRVSRFADWVQGKIGDDSPPPSGEGYCQTPNLAIPDNNANGTAATMTINASGRLSDLDITLDVSHSFVGDLVFTLEHVNTGTRVTLVDRPQYPASSFGCRRDDIQATLDDEAGSPVENACATGVPTINGVFRPQEALSAFDNETLSGQWRLRAYDRTSSDTGVVNEWCLVPTTGQSPPPPPPPPAGDGTVYLSVSSKGNVQGVSYAPGDILAYDQATGAWSLYFDGSDVGIKRNLVGFVRQNNGHLLLTFLGKQNLPGLGNVPPQDIVRFVPTSLGENTAGSFHLYFDGSDVGLTTRAESVDALTLDASGNLLISTTGTASVGTLRTTHQDLLRFTPTQLGTNTAGSWSLYFDGSDEEITRNLWGAWVDGDSGDLYLSFDRPVKLNGNKMPVTAVIRCRPQSLGEDSRCDFSDYWNAAEHGLGNRKVDGIFLVP